MNVITFKIFYLITFLILLSPALFAQEALTSINEKYFNFLSLQGYVQRPALNFRTLSDSVWNIDESIKHPWQNNNLGSFHQLGSNFRMRVYGPELFMSVNTAAPYGHNDGLLWQGRGFNSKFRSGLRFEGLGFEITLLPHFAFSQNASFRILPSNTDSEFGYFWGHRHNVGVDAPQRFGGTAFFDWDFGDSEIRFTWRTFTVGFGTQAIWLGPSFLNSILHTNNAPAYPRFDIGLRRQPVRLPFFGWYIGDIEARLWVGRLTGSDFFDNNNNMRHTMFHGLAFAYAPSFLPGLTLFANRVVLVPWKWKNLKFVIPSTDNTFGDWGEDQKFSLGFSWLFTQIGLEIFGELGVDDTIQHGFPVGYIRYMQHTMVYTVGLKKNVSILPRRNIFGQILFEWNHMEMSQNNQLRFLYSFYFHHQMIRGYTNRGQWLGNAVSPGGNSQFLGFRVFYPRGTSLVFLHRYNPDNNYIYSKAIFDSVADSGLRRYNTNFKGNLAIGINTHYFFTNSISLGGGLVYILTVNPYFYHNKTDFTRQELRHNFSFQFLFKIQL